MGETEEKETAAAAATDPQTEAEEPKETDSMLKKEDESSEKPTEEVKKSKENLVEAKEDAPKKEEVIEIPDSEEKKDDEKEKPTKDATEGVKSSKKIPIPSFKLPGFLSRNKKPAPESDGAENELLAKNDADVEKGAADEATPAEGEEAEKKEGDETTPAATEGSRFSSNLMGWLKNPFAKKEEATPAVTADAPTTETTDGAEAKPEGEEEKATEEKTEAEKPKENGADEAKPVDESTAEKKSVLSNIRLPHITLSNLIPRRLRPGNRASEDLEMGSGPKTKAGLASMETLDDSLKDTDQTDKAVNGKTGDEDLETVKLDDKEEKPKDKAAEAAEDQQKPKPFMDRIREYQCSVDDWAIAAGIAAFLLLVAIICVFTFCGKSEPKVAPIKDGRFVDAVTTCGFVEGLYEESAFAFRGIPYAEPPTGENRWRPAQVIDNIDSCWNGTFLAHNSTDVCLQTTANGTVIGTEDCLTLDVITPHVRYDNPLPVVVLIGAESVLGDSPSRLRPSKRYARARDVVFVRPNFRMGVFGFLALDELSKSAHPPRSGNYALSDIIAALKWIQLNIANFGGDAKSVTLFGHRTGATLVTALTTSPLAKDLYARAWVTSGSAQFPGQPLADYEKKNKEFMALSKCKTADCLRNVSDKDILDAVPDTWGRNWPDLPAADENTTTGHNWLILDGEILFQHPADVWSKEEQGPTRLVIGTTAHESHSEKLYQKHKEWTSELVRKHVEESRIGQLNLTEEVFKRYNATYQGLVSMITDIRTVCPLLTIARQQQNVPFYLVTQTGGNLTIADVDADILAILGRYEPKTPEERRYVSAIQQLFYHYVSHGTVAQFDSRRPVLEIGQDVLPAENLEKCDFWIQADVVPRYAKLD